MPVGWETGREYEIIVFNDASSDGTAELLNEYQDQIQVINGDGTGWYALNNNRMAEQAQGKWLCMLNNDTELRPAWIGPMLALAQKHPDAGVIGNIHVFPGSEIVNHAGVVFNGKHIPRNLYDGLPLDTQGVRQDREVQASMAACWITPRELFAQVSGFDERYRTGYEDVDYCLRLRESGHRVYISSQSVIAHHGGSTPGRYVSDAKNERLFLSQWKSSVLNDVNEIPDHEGVDWPRRSNGYTIARSVWRNPIVRRSLSPILKTQAGARLRQRMARKLMSDSVHQSSTLKPGQTTTSSQQTSTKSDSNYFLTAQGHCPACGNESTFRSKHHWLRDHFLCQHCNSVPRERALMHVLEMYYPDWREMRIHESSPGGRGASITLRAQCKHYTATQYDTKIPFGESHPSGQYQSENLEEQTFADDSFDLVISQDVMEHVFDPDAAFREVARTLKPGGAHIFTTPLVNKLNPTECCAKLNDDGSVEHLREPEYHGNPIDSSGSLVTFRWGYDITQRIHAATGHSTTLVALDDLSKGIRAEYIEVCVTHAPGQLKHKPSQSKSTVLHEFKAPKPQINSNVLTPPNLNFDLPRPGIASGNLHTPLTQWSDPNPREPIGEISDQLDEHPRAREILETFDSETYLKANTDLSEAGISIDHAMEHFVENGYRQRRVYSRVLHDLVDPAFYRNQYPELALENDSDAISHYAYIGRYEDRIPNQLTKMNMEAKVHLYQMGKVGSKTIEEAVAKAGGGDSLHLHWADQFHEQYPTIGVHYSRILNHRRSEPACVVVGVRDPFERVVSGYFQEAETLKIKKNFADQHAAMEQLSSRFARDAWVICNWFDHNFYCGLDIHEHAFDPKLGYSVIEHENIRVFLYRVDVLNQLQQPLSEFLGLPKLTIGKKNTGGDKLYADVYKEVSDQFRVPHEIASKLIESKYAKHFFSDTELSRMVETWSDRQPATH
jgi:glycosyltransferase involved in cell wall biosynthesis